jgi:L-threonylcarbamoyladenylate synthase
MKRAAVFLDRDGTLIEDRGHLSDPGQVVFYPETAHALRRLQPHFLLFIVTNQNGISRGVLQPQEAERVNAHVVRCLQEEGVSIREVYCCPHTRQDGCACIKPQPFFPLRAAADHAVDLARSFVVGDHPADVELAVNAGARGIYVLSGHGRKHREELNAPCDITDGISAAADAILCAKAADVLGGGGLVAFPTETVYGLGADALNRTAVRKIFEVKGRPLRHPLIVHLADAASLHPWAAEVPEAALRLTERLWPGPLTLVLRRSARVPDEVTGGQDTVALRVPSHPLARRLLKEFHGGIAAPSANRFGRVSPTRVEHVLEDLGPDVDFVLDGGSCDVGVESTILDLSADAPCILRPGGVTQEAIEAVLGCGVPVRPSKARVPGSHATHYAPRAELRIVPREELEARHAALSAQGVRARIVEPKARTLYADLREADRRGAEVILVALPDESGLGLAVADRLKRAAGPRGSQTPCGTG